MTWHVDARAWEAYVAGELDPAAEASVETHVLGCPECREAARSQVEPSTRETIWAEVRSTIAAPALPAVLRPLRRLGVRGDDLVVVSAGDSLLASWSLAVGFAVACTCLLGLTGLSATSQEAAYLVLAPLVPVLAVVASFDALDPLREVAQPTPFSKLRLALLRATAALVVALPVTMAIGLVVPNMQELAFVWLMPALGLTSAALVLLTWFEAPVAGALVAVVWTTFVILLRSAERVDALTTPTAQLGFAAGAVALAIALTVRTSTLRLQGGEW